MRRNAVGISALALCLATFTGGRAFAGLAADDASNYASWGNGSTGGSGFTGGWAISNTGSGGSGGGFLSNGNAGNQIGTGGSPGKAWGIFGNGGGVGDATRTLSSAIAINETLIIDMDNGFIDGGGTVGLSLRNGSDQNLAEFFFVGGQPNYTFNASSVLLASGSAQGFTNQGLRLEFTLTTATTLKLTVDRLIDGSVDATYTGTLFSAGAGQAITKIRLFNANAGNNTPTTSDHDSYFNSILVTVVPEASAVWFGGLAIGVTGLVAAYRRLRCRLAEAR